MYALLTDDKVYLFDSYIHKNTIKEIKGCKWDFNNKNWIIPNNDENLLLLKILGCEFKNYTEDKIIRNPKKEQNIESIIPKESMPIKTIPYLHQIEAYNKACSILRIFRR
jgi:hypothetical protein